MAHLHCDLVDGLLDAHDLNASTGKFRKDFESLAGGSAESIQSFDDHGMDFPLVDVTEQSGESMA